MGQSITRTTCLRVGRAGNVKERVWLSPGLSDLPVEHYRFSVSSALKSWPSSYRSFISGNVHQGVTGGGSVSHNSRAPGGGEATPGVRQPAEKPLPLAAAAIRQWTPPRLTQILPRSLLRTPEESPRARPGPASIPGRRDDPLVEQAPAVTTKSRQTWGRGRP